MGEKPAGPARRRRGGRDLTAGPWGAGPVACPRRPLPAIRAEDPRRTLYLRVGAVEYRTTIAGVQQVLGQADLSTTSIYLRLAAAGLHDSARAAPIARLLRPR